MASFLEAFDRLIKLEGGFCNDKDDKGGATNFGISSIFINNTNDFSLIKNGLDANKDGVISADEIVNLTQEDAKEIYKCAFWDRNRYKRIRLQSLANQCFDFAVHAGSYRANLYLQQCINGFLKRLNAAQIKEDGIIGPITWSEANFFGEYLVQPYKQKRKEFYCMLCSKDKTQEKYLQGWLNRIEHD